MTKILIAIDGSKSSLKALDYVVKRKRQGEDIQAHIVNVQPAIAPRGRLVTRSMIDDYQTQESEKVFGQSQVKAKKNYLEADAYSQFGDPTECIVEFARKTKCDEIVIGSRGLGGVKGLLLGSVASKVVQTSPVPVVVVK